MTDTLPACSDGLGCHVIITLLTDIQASQLGIKSAGKSIKEMLRPASDSQSLSGWPSVYKNASPEAFHTSAQNTHGSPH